MPVDDQPDLTLEEEPKPDAEKMADVLSEINIADIVLPIEDEVLVSQSAPIAPNAKAKRVSKQDLF